jgi:hypothetical protein
MSSKGKKKEVVEESEEEVDAENSEDEVMVPLFSSKSKNRLKRRLRNCPLFMKKFKPLPSTTTSSKKESSTRNCKLSKKPSRENSENSTSPTSMK